MHRLIVAALCVGGLRMSPARADTPSQVQLPSCLDQSIRDELGHTLRPRGVQKRVFLKRHRLELVGRGGLFAADMMSSSYAYGGAATYWLTEDVGLELSLDVTPVRLDLDAPLAAFFGDDRFETPGTAYLALAGLVWAPIHAKMKIAGDIVHSDILLALGAGRLVHDTVQGVTFDAGAAIDLYATKRVTVRVDLRDVIAIQEAIGHTRVTHNILATMGLALWLPLW